MFMTLKGKLVSGLETKFNFITIILKSAMILTNTGKSVTNL